MSVHYITSNSFLYANGVKIYQFKAKYFERKPYPLSLGNISEDFTVSNMKKLGFTVNYETVDTSDIDTHKIFYEKT